MIGLIPARGGSKSVPRKNIRLLRGKPLVQYTIDAARAAKRLARVILSTEDEEIANVGIHCGAEVPFLRPPDLAKDSTPMLPVVQHALRWLEEKGDFYEAVCLLQPTSPLRRPVEIDDCIDLLERSGADSVVTVAPVPFEYNPHWVYLVKCDGTLGISTGEKFPIDRRQDLPDAFHRTGSVFLGRRDLVMERNTFYGDRLVGYVVNWDQNIQIDSADDWEKAENMLETFRIENRDGGAKNDSPI